MIYQQQRDEELLAALKNDDEGAFRELYNRYWRKMYVVAANRVYREEDAEEIVQDIFAALWIRRETLVITDDGLAKYLAVCVKYRVIKTLSKYAVGQKIPERHSR